MDVKEFLNSKSMLTPGVAGLIAMLATNALHVQFGLPQNWVGLALSFLVGSLVFGDVATPPSQRLALYVINSLIIFSIAVGANTAGTAATPKSSAMFPNADLESTTFFQDWFEN